MYHIYCKTYSCQRDEFNIGRISENHVFLCSSRTSWERRKYGSI